MFGIGSTELLVILVVALIVLGPTSLAKVSRSLGKMVGEFRRVSTDFQRTLNVEAAEQEARERKAAREATQRNTSQDNPDSATHQASSPEPPADSPLAQSIARARSEAAATDQTRNDSSHAS